MKIKYIKKMYLLILFVLSITFTHYLNAKVIDLSNKSDVNVKAIFNNANTIQSPSNSSYCIGNVGDYITFEAEVYEEEYWWWNTTYRYNYKTVTVKIIVFKYQTAIYSNGDFYSKTDRYYNL